jgi:hypothetical protein
MPSPSRRLAAPAAAPGRKRAAAAAVDEAARLEQLRRRLVRKARKFDAPSLLAALAQVGYGEDAIVFKSRHGTSRGASLIHAVELLEKPERRAVVTVNIGLLGSESPLPSYVQKVVERAPDRLVPFFEYFDHTLIKSRFKSLQPERDPAIVSDWETARQSVSRLVRLDTPASAHWLFRRVYPELEVAVRRAPGKRKVATTPLRVGKSAVGSAETIGGLAEVMSGGLAVLLVAPDANAANGRPWQDEAATRMSERLLPLMPESDMALTVTLLIRERPNQLQLQSGNFLGLQALQGGNEAARVLIFDGTLVARGELAAG